MELKIVLEIDECTSYEMSLAKAKEVYNELKVLFDKPLDYLYSKKVPYKPMDIHYSDNIFAGLHRDINP